jgi:signal transduction histidine kinase
MRVVPLTGNAASGLGLPIARHIAELHNTGVRRSTRPDNHGLMVSMRFPAP